VALERTQGKHILAKGLPLLLTLLLSGTAPAQENVQSMQPSAAMQDSLFSLVSSGRDTLRTKTGELHPDTPGAIAGHVTSKQTGESMDYTNIVFHTYDDHGNRKQVGGTIALTDGYYVYRCVPGTYEITFIYIGYERYGVKNVVVEPAALTVTDVELKVKPIPFDQLTITAARIEHSEFSMREQQKKHAAVSDNISREEMSRGTDSTAAEALERVTGVTVLEGKFVFVRGLGDRYSQTQLNGATLSSPEPNKRTVPLDVFPSSLLDNVVIQKTFTPDMEGEFGGGVVNVNTRDSINKRGFAQKLEYGYDSNVLEHGAMDYKGGKYDVFGFDDGTRELPKVVGEDPLRRASRSNPDGYTLEDLQEIRKEFPNVWEPRRSGSRPNFSYSGDYSDNYYFLFGRKLSFLGALTLKNSYSTIVGRVDREYRSDIESPERDYETSQTKFSTLGGATGSFSYQLSGDDILKFNAFYSRSTDDVARISEGENADYGSTVRQYSLGYLERGLGSQVLSGKHTFFGNQTLDWVGSYSDAYFGEPDRRRVIYEDRTGEGNFELSSRVQNPFLRIYGESREYDRAAQLNWAAPLLPRWLGESEIKLGMAHRNRDRASAYRRFGIDCFSCGTVDESMSPETLLDPKNPDTQAYFIQEDTRPADSWNAGQEVNAAYAMADLRMGRLRAVGGLRLERVDTHVFAKSRTAVNADAINVTRRYEDGLPALNMSYGLNDKQNLRFSYSKTLNRPELREVSPFSMYNYDENVEEVGNPNLVQARIHSYDVRWEYYPGYTKLISVSGFYKDLRNPIEQKLLAFPGSVGRAPTNADNGILRGLEFEARLTVPDVVWYLSLCENRPRGKAGRWAVQFNYSRIHSRVNVPTNLNVTADTPRRRTSLTGQSNSATNLSLLYKGDALGGSLALKSFGERLFAAGLGTLPDIYEHPGRTLDLALDYKFGRFQQYKIKFSAENLTGNVVERLQGHAVFQRWVPSRKFGLSISFRRQ